MNKEIRLSYDILSDVYLDHAYLSIALNKHSDHNINFALVTRICYGVLEKDITLEYMISNFITKKPSANVYLILKIGTYIAKYLKSIPDYAMVNELVNLTKRVDSRSAGFVNATLKNISSGKVEIPNTSDNIYNLSCIYSVPYAWVKEFVSVFGDEKTIALLKCKLNPLTHIRILGDTEEFYKLSEKFDIKYEKSNFDDTCYIDYGKILGIEDFNQKYVVQGLPSIIAARNGGRGESAYDVCSAPGGKTMILSSNFRSVLASDLYPHRLDIVKSYARKLNISNISYLVSDASKYNSELDGKFDLVLLDVPCSGLGVTLKKPDIYLNRTLDDLDELNETQLSIINNASKYVKRGGTLIYSTCSILPCENERIVEKFLDSNSDFKLRKVDTFGVKTIDSKFGQTFMPHISGTEGFFISKMERK